MHTLATRLLAFAIHTNNYCKNIDYRSHSYPYSVQLIKSSSSIGANYMEAYSTDSKKDFVHKITLAKKEAQETEYWLHLLKATTKSPPLPLLKEIREINRILNAIQKTSKKNLAN